MWIVGNEESITSNSMAFRNIQFIVSISKITTAFYSKMWKTSQSHPENSNSPTFEIASKIFIFKPQNRSQVGNWWIALNSGLLADWTQIHVSINNKIPRTSSLTHSEHTHTFLDQQTKTLAQNSRRAIRNNLLAKVMTAILAIFIPFHWVRVCV